MPRTARPRPSSCHVVSVGKRLFGPLFGGAGTRLHPKVFQTPIKPWNSGKLAALVWQQLDLPPCNPKEFAILFFCPPFPLSMQKFAVLNASRMAALAAAGKVVSFFLNHFFLTYACS